MAKLWNNYGIISKNTKKCVLLTLKLFHINQNIIYNISMKYIRLKYFI